MKKSFSSLLFGLILKLNSIPVNGQDIRSNEVLFINGYSEIVCGTGNLIPDKNLVLYVNAYSGEEKIEWLTEILSENVRNQFVEFSWIAGIGASHRQKLFELFLNNEPIIHFYSKKNNWETEKNNNRLSFTLADLDKNGDCWGIMSLKIPAWKLVKGKPQKLGIKGSNALSNAWVMISGKPIEKSIDLTAPPAIRKENGKLYRMVEARIFNFKEDNQVFNQTFSKKDKVVLNVSSLPKGIYLCKVNMINTRRCLKFVKT